MGKFMIIIGILFILLGIFITYGPKLPFLGKLPGDITIDKGNFRIYFPLATSIVISILISFLLYLYHRLRN